MNKYYVAPPSKIQKPSREFQDQHNKFMKRAYKELLEDCTKLMSSKQPYKTMYTLDGELLKTMDDLKSFCEQDVNDCRKVKIKLSLASPVSVSESPKTFAEKLHAEASRKLVGGVSYVVIKSEHLKAKSQEQFKQSPQREFAEQPSEPVIKESLFSQRKEIENLQEQSQILHDLDGNNRHPKIVLLSTTKEDFFGIKDLNLT